MEPVIKINAVGQVCVVVKDLQMAMENYWKTFGIGPWSVYTFQPSWIRDMTYKGKPADHGIKLAVAMLGPVMFELIQPLWGDTVYADFLREHGEGLHHLGFLVKNMDEDIDKLKAAGVEVIQSGLGFGSEGEGGYAYLSTEDDFGTTFELIEMPDKLPPPEAIYPPKD